MLFHDFAVYTPILLCFPYPYIFASSRSLIGIPKLCDTPPPSLAYLFPVYRYLTSPRILHVRICFVSVFRPHHMPFSHKLAPLLSSAMIVRTYCVPFYVYALILWNVIICSSLSLILWGIANIMRGSRSQPKSTSQSG